MYWKFNSIGNNKQPKRWYKREGPDYSSLVVKLVKRIFMSAALFHKHVFCSFLLLKESTKKEIIIIVGLAKTKGKSVYPNMKLEYQGGESKCTHVLESSGLMLQCMTGVTGWSHRIFILFKTNNPRWCTPSTIRH